MASRREHYGSTQTKNIGFKSIEIFKDQVLGVGSFGAVCNALCDDLPCAAKILHPTLLQVSAQHQNARRREHRLPRKRFEQECEFMSAIRHPNIVQYLGMHRDTATGLPALLMELMDDNLTHFLETSAQPLLYHIVVNFCRDITLALSFLHSNGIIHRDLSGNNVLLIGTARAKVTDFGMARLTDLNPQASHLTYTMCPGTDVYMPPEAVKEKPEYNEKIDCFSFGVIAIQTMTRKFPDPGDRQRPLEVEQVGTVNVPIPEIERRQNHINEIEPNHPLLTIAISCLHRESDRRPSAQMLYRSVTALRQSDDYRQSKRTPSTEQLVCAECNCHYLIAHDNSKSSSVSEADNLQVSHFDENDGCEFEHQQTSQAGAVAEFTSGTPEIIVLESQPKHGICSDHSLEKDNHSHENDDEKHDGNSTEEEVQKDLTSAEASGTSHRRKKRFTLLSRRKKETPGSKSKKKKKKEKKTEAAVEQSEKSNQKIRTILIKVFQYCCYIIDHKGKKRRKLRISFRRKHREMRVLMLGLDAAGKTTILYHLKLVEVVSSIPTIGFNVETVHFNQMHFTIWDVSGQDKVRPLWRRYFLNTQALIFVVDAHDRERIGEARQEFHWVLDHDEMRNAIVLVFVNKMDLPNVMSPAEVQEKMELASLRHHHWHIQASCAVTGDGLYEGLLWLKMHQVYRK